MKAQIKARSKTIQLRLRVIKLAEKMRLRPAARRAKRAGYDDSSADSEWPKCKAVLANPTRIINTAKRKAKPSTW